MEKKNEPKNKYRYGTVCLTRWENRSQSGEDFDTYSLDISYFDKETGSYKPAKSLSQRQLLQLQVVVNKALMDDVGGM